MAKPKIALTIGDPAGVGPEIIAKLLRKGEIFALCDPVVYGDGEVIEQACAIVGGEERFSGGEICFGDEAVKVVNPMAGKEKRTRRGYSNMEGHILMMESVKRAVTDAVEGYVDGVVTCPITKEGMQRAGYDYPGHTEFIRELTGAGKVVMMLAGERLKVALVTAHVPLRDAAEMVEREVVHETVEVVHRDFVEKLGVRGPRIAVAGLNPHAGEGGIFGDEEIRCITPAVERLRERGMDVSGPYSPDTVFQRAYHGEFDVVIAMYHDQGLIPLKLVHFDTGVNVTLGLPIVRTSVDHGTAYDIAWQGIASEQSLQAAVHFALKMLKGKRGGE